MTLRPREILDVCREAAEALVGRPLQKVVQPDARTLLLGFPRRWLAIVLSPRFGRLHLLDEKPPGSGEAAPAFCMLLRKRLTGERLSEVEVVAGERACALRFANGDALRLFFFGAGARAVLVDAAGAPLGAIGPGREATALPPPRADPSTSRFPSENPSAAIAAHYAGAEARAAADEARVRAVAEGRRAVDKLRRREQALAGDLARADAAATRRRDADLLLAHLADVPRGAAEVTLPDDFAGGEPLVIRLDPAQSATDNAKRLYKEHKRLSRARAAIEARLAETRAARADAERALARAEAGEFTARAPAPPKPRRPGVPAPRPPYKVFRSSTGAEILVGRGADKNDQLTFHVARGNDLWMHTRDYPGAHVVVPLAGAPVDQQTLLDAATLAVHHSQARGQLAADVTWAPRKLVRKPRGAAPGLVSVAGGRTLRVRMEPERLRRLLATEEK